jgi:DUF971 family protein
MPSAVDVDRSTGVTITWEDGHNSTFGIAVLRRACPCAGCRAGQTMPPPAGLTITDVDLAGSWGMTPTWSDGHATGIYSWEYLWSVAEEA